MAGSDRNSVAFPTLTATQIEALGHCAATAPRTLRDGDVLFRVGQREFGFFVVKSGTVEVTDESGGERRVLVTHGPGQFTGDVSHLTGNPAVVTASARGRCEVYEIPAAKLRRVLDECPELSDVILGAFIARRQLLYESPDFVGLRVIGSRYSADTSRVRDFLARNRVLFTWVDLETDPQVDELLRGFGVSEADTPVVACGTTGGLLLRNPTNRELADAVGIHRPAENAVYDLAIIGAGPAGLAAAVYGASEGLATIVLEATAPGGQAGASMRIENYLGFPSGLTGRDLADRATLQANKFGAHLSIGARSVALGFVNGYAVLRLDDGVEVTARCLLIATGADYRRLDLPGCQRFEGAGIYYAATPNEAPLCRGCTAVVVGGGNSAGQAVVYLAGQAERVVLVVRGGDLRKGMSSYLARRIEQASNVDVCLNSTIRRMDGDGHLAAVEIVDSTSGAVNLVDTPTVFSFLGAVPRTDWLPAEIQKDQKGFVRTGPLLGRTERWRARREPFLLETSVEGVFAAGDVRSGSAKRVAAAVGEGAMAVQFVHQHLGGG